MESAKTKLEPNPNRRTDANVKEGNCKDLQEEKLLTKEKGNYKANKRVDSHGEGKTTASLTKETREK